MRISSYEVLGKLPDVFMCDDGRRISDVSQWRRRRAEIVKTAVGLQFGSLIPDPEFLDVECNTDPGKAILCCTVKTGTRESPVTMQLTVMKPAGDGPFPIAVDGDLCFRYPYDPEFIHAFTDNGIALVLFNRTELAPDRESNYRSASQLCRTYPGGSFGAIAAWAWGYSRCVDAMLKLGIADASSITFTGHSRGGKTAALAGALDERATIVNPNSTCAGACGCYRIHMSALKDDGREYRSETLDDLMRNFGFWMGPDLEWFRTKESDLPFDFHYLKALVAPRTLYISEAENDIWSNPVGSWQTTVAASEVYRFLGAPDNVYWSFRAGEHEHRVEDIRRLVSLILHKKDGSPLCGGFFSLPFEKKEPIFDWSAPEAEKTKRTENE